jgi:hypothetical protein
LRACTIPASFTSGRPFRRAIHLRRDVVALRRLTDHLQFLHRLHFATPVVASMLAPVSATLKRLPPISSP